MKLIGETVRIEQLTHKDRKEMFSLYRSFFDYTDVTVFERDLSEKSWAILLRDKNNHEIKGFSTQAILTVRKKQACIRALYSGDTIIHREYWGEWELIRQWGKLALSIIQKNETSELYWFLVCMGYKTYRFLPLFFKEYYPCPHTPTPESMRHIIDLFGKKKFESHFHPQSGIIRLNGSRVALKNGVADIHPNLMKNDHVQFFCEVNPGHTQGDELACIACLSMDNFKKSANRIARFDEFNGNENNSTCNDGVFNGLAIP